MRLPLLLILVSLASCTGVRAVDDVDAANDRSLSETKLRAMMPSRPRTGQLVVEEKALHLRIRRGEQTVPLMSVPRGTFELGCQAPPGKQPGDRAVWWMFSGDGEAVALQFTTHEVAVWIWDGERDCAVTMNPLDTPTFEFMPPDYYKADDAQVAYRWNHNFVPYGQFAHSSEAAQVSGVTRGGDEDILPDVPGIETLVVERDYIAMRTADGRTLLQKQFEIDPDWPCYRAEVSVFGAPAASFYAVASFETFGTFTDCEARSGETRLQSEIFDWDPERGVFVSAFATSEQWRALGLIGENTKTSVTRNLRVDGGVLRIERDTDVRYLVREGDGCARSSATHSASFRLVTAAGATLTLGEASDREGEHDEDCTGRVP